MQLGVHQIQGSVAVLRDQSRYKSVVPIVPAPSDFNATFASTDGYLYGVDLMTGGEIWSHALSAAAYDAPVVDRNSIIYVGDGASVLNAVQGKLDCPGCAIWSYGGIRVGGVADIVKLGVTNEDALVVGSGISAYGVFN